MTRGERETRLVLVVAQLLFDLLALGDVDADADPALDGAVGGLDRRSATLEPADIAVRHDHAVLHREVDAGAGGRGQALDHRVAVIRMHPFEERVERAAEPLTVEAVERAHLL